MPTGQPIAILTGHNISVKIRLRDQIQDGLPTLIGTVAVWGVGPPIASGLKPKMERVLRRVGPPWQGIPL